MTLDLIPKIERMQVGNGLTDRKTGLVKVQRSSKEDRQQINRAHRPFPTGIERVEQAGLVMFPKLP
jgi:hypothetical protein